MATKKKKPLVWRRVLKQAKAAGRFSWVAKARARDWATCAVGEQRQAFPRVAAVLGRGKQGPEDETLYELGMRFMRQVLYDEVDKAIDTYADIQRETVLRVLR
jgi:hypothetical protein